MPAPISRLRRWKLPLQGALLALFIPLVGGTGLLVGAITSQRMAVLAKQEAERELGMHLQATRANWRRLLDQRLSLLELEQLQQHGQLLAGGGSERWLAALPFFLDLLAQAPAVRSVYLGDQTGSLFRVSRVGVQESVEQRNRSSRQVLMEVVSRHAGHTRFHVERFDAQLRSLGVQPPSAELLRYDPRQRPWYQLAQASPDHKAVISPPHELMLSGGLGITLSNRFTDGRGAVGLSLRAEDLEAQLSRFLITPSTQLALVDGSERLLLSTEPALKHQHLQPLGTLASAPLRALAPLLAKSTLPLQDPPRMLRFQVADQPWLAVVAAIPRQGSDASDALLVTLPEQELLAPSQAALRQAQLITLLVVLLSVPLVILAARRTSRALRQLSRQSRAVLHFDFDEAESPASHLEEVDALAESLQMMRRTIRSFLQASAALGAEPDVERLLQRLLDEAIASAEASRGALLTGDQAGQASAEAADPCCLQLPLHSRDGRVLGGLVLYFDEPPDPARVAFCRALSGSAAVALETRSLIAAQKQLFQALIELIAAAIDAKSPYTGGHCARVPELAQMLAQAACDSDSGPYRSFSLSPDDWEALHMASWLHDCGKVTTPEYVVDKATKLETIYDRIHEVRMRFELLKCAAECEFWRGMAAGGAEQQLRSTLEARWAALDDDFAFVAACNQGGEGMRPEDLSRLERIASTTWRRTLDDRLGLSHDELQRYEAEPRRPLPCEEPLLMDRPHHRRPRPAQHRLEVDNPWGFTMPQPELLLDSGELYNLRIERGTLSAEERYTINEHIVQTIRMLSALPLPEHLRSVAEIAGGHHERLDGRGYPRGLRAEQMSPLARMMAIADVFEALTAADRPYKSGKTLSESLRIMAAMVRDQHLDADLFELFVRAGLPRRYGERFLAADQLDELDVEALLQQ